MDTPSNMARDQIPLAAQITAREISEMWGLISELHADAQDASLSRQTREEALIRAQALQRMVDVVWQAARQSEVHVDLPAPVNAPEPLADPAYRCGDWVRLTAFLAEGHATAEPWRLASGPLAGLPLTIKPSREDLPELWVARRRCGELLIRGSMIREDGAPARVPDDTVVLGWYRPAILESGPGSYDWVSSACSN